MIRFFAVLLLAPGLGLSVYAQEHTKAPTTTKQSATPKATPTPTRTNTRRRTRNNTRRPTTPQTTPAVTTSNGQWSLFTSKPGRFSVLLPGTPEDSVETKPSEQGPYTTHLYILKDQRNVFVIGWVDYDPSFNFNRHLELEMNRDKFIENQKATLRESREIRIDGYQVIEFTAEAPEQIFRSRVYMVGRRPYLIIIGSPKGLDDSVAVNRFFNSFKVSAS